MSTAEAEDTERIVTNMCQLILFSLLIPAIFSDTESCDIRDIFDHADHVTYMYKGTELTKNITATLPRADYPNIQFVCDEGYSLGYGVSDKIELISSTGMKYVCKPCHQNCVILSKDISTVTLKVIKGEDRILVNGTKIGHGEAITATCKDGKTLEKTNHTVETMTCDFGHHFNVMCYTPCNGSEKFEIQEGFTTYSSVVGVGQSVWINKCKHPDSKSDYKYIPGSYDYLGGPETDITCQEDGSFSSESMPLEFRCYAKPDIRLLQNTNFSNVIFVVRRGDRQVTDTGRGLTLKKAVVQRVINDDLDQAETLFTRELNKLDDPEVVEEFLKKLGGNFSISDLEYGTSGFVTVALHYEGYDKPITGAAKFITRIPALDISTWIMKYDENLRNVKIMLSDDQLTSSLAEIRKTYTLVEEFTLELFCNGTEDRLWWSMMDSIGSIFPNHTELVGDVMYKVWDADVSEGALTEGGTCRVEITSTYKIDGGTLVLNSTIDVDGSDEVNDARASGEGLVAVLLSLVVLLVTN